MTKYNKAIGEGWGGGQIAAALNYNEFDKYGGQKIGGICEDGVLKLGGHYQGTHELSTTQNYLLGARRTTIDHRVFRYGYCGTTLADTKHGCKNDNILVTELANIVSACSAGATLLTVTFDGDFWDIAVAENSLYGGYISLYNSGTIRDQRMIVGNTSIGSGGGAAMYIQIDEPIVTAVGSTFKCEIMANPYSNLVGKNDGESSVLGMPCAYAAAGDYFWIQTWGPHRITPTGAELTTVDETRQFVFDSQGGVYSHEAEHDKGDCSYQHAGFIINRTDSQAGSAAPFIMLQISP